LVEVIIFSSNSICAVFVVLYLLWCRFQDIILLFLTHNLRSSVEVKNLFLFAVQNCVVYISADCWEEFRSVQFEHTTFERDLWWTRHADHWGRFYTHSRVSSGLTWLVTSLVVSVESVDAQPD